MRADAREVRISAAVLPVSFASLLPSANRYAKRGVKVRSMNPLRIAGSADHQIGKLKTR